MSYYNVMQRMKSNITDGSEFNNGQFVEEGVIIGHTICDYCGKEVIAVWDKHNSKNYWPYLGNQAVMAHNYRYSKIINTIRKFYGVENEKWDQNHGNNLLNVHARCHSSPTNWAKRISPASIRLLCNNCFLPTYNRIKVLGDDGILYALSVVKSRGETIESVMKELGITGQIIGKGAIKDYD